ncbi:hypothetical protein BT96DRAFT_912475 [Gymnopus androsaceus JB14]|uniref:Uncharacterized protein n=1 Tax=Gymnopus androsaceus JB14 TaxID=1447944 RepID=A0A6A4IPT8_9AGAR|nr:hypothetical protein BT96DRAFT_912475 [Gymnopus androsaceus JB14]
MTTPHTAAAISPASSVPPRRGLRLPSRKYQGRNGFTEDHPDSTTAQKIELFEHARDILQLRSVTIPSFDEIMNTDWTKPPEPDTSVSVQKEIYDLRASHGAFLSKIYDLNASAYLDDVEYRYQSRNEVLDEDPRVWMKREFTDNPKATHKNYAEDELKEMIDASNAQKELYETTPPYPFTLTAPTPAHLPSISRHNYAYLKQLLELYRKLQRVKEKERLAQEAERLRLEQEEYNRQRREEETRRLAQIEKDRLEKRFPTTVEEFNAKPRDFQGLIVKFFNAPTKHLQEKQLVTNKWTWEDVKPLMKIYDKNDQFRTRIIGMFLNIDQGASSDPRRRIS